MITGEASYAILRAVTPMDMIILAGQGGRERIVELEALEVIKAAPVTCPDCQVQHQVDRESLRCADCERDWARAQPKPSETCEDCGGLGAFYSPRSRRFLDTACHVVAGSLTGNGPELRVMTREAPCRTDDVDSERHDWRKAKSSFLCRLCNIKVNVRPAGYGKA